MPVFLAVIVATWLTVACGTLRGALPEEAKPTTPAQEFVVAVAEFNRLAEECNVWLSGVVASARVGDPEARRYLPIAERMGSLIDAGEAMIADGQLAFMQGDLESFLANGRALDAAITSLQREVLAAGLGGAQ